MGGGGAAAKGAGPHNTSEGPCTSGVRGGIQRAHTFLDVRFTAYNKNPNNNNNSNSNNNARGRVVGKLGNRAVV